MTQATHTVALPTLRRASRKKPKAVALAAPRATLLLGCVLCGAGGHDRTQCAMGIVDEKTGRVS